MLCLLCNCKLPFCSFFVLSLSHVWNFATPWTTALQASLCFTISLSLLKLMSLELVMPSNRLILCCSFLLLPSIFPSIRVFSNESALHIRWPKCWNFSFSIRPSNKYSGLISFRIDWFDLSPRDSQESSQTPQFKASILPHSVFFMVQLSHLYMTTGKTSYHLSLLKLTSSQAGAVSYSSVFAWLIRRCWGLNIKERVCEIVSNRVWGWIEKEK